MDYVNEFSYIKPTLHPLDEAYLIVVNDGLDVFLGSVYDNFIDRYQVPKLSQDQINHLKSPVTPKEIEEVIKNLPTKKSPGPDEFSAEFYQTFKEDLIPILFKLSHKIERRNTAQFIL